MAVTPYLSLDEFKQLALIPAAFIDEVEEMAPGFVGKQIELESSRVDARLSKRYATPFNTPAPIAVRAWVTTLVQPAVELKRGVGPESSNYDEYKRLAGVALDELKEAANAETGLFDLPLRGDASESGIARGAPRSYSEQSPYVFTDEQGRTGREEDHARSGTGR